MSMTSLSSEAIRAFELCRTCAELDPHIYEDLYASLLKNRPELVPAQRPEPNETAIRTAWEVMLKERALMKSTPPPSDKK